MFDIDIEIEIDSKMVVDSIYRILVTLSVIIDTFWRQMLWTLVLYSLKNKSMKLFIVLLRLLHIYLVSVFLSLNQ